MMVSETVSQHVECIGTIAGQIWQFLREHEPITVSKLAREMDAPRDLIMQGVGWLAREGKIEFQQGARKKQIRLVE